MSTSELVEWEAFEEDFGPMTLHERVDGAVAILLHAYHGGRGDVSDFYPQWERADAAHVVDWLSAVARKP